MNAHEHDCPAQKVLRRIAATCDTAGTCSECSAACIPPDIHRGDCPLAPAPTEAGDPYRPGALLDELDACDVILDGEDQ